MKKFEKSDGVCFATLAMTSTANVHKRNCHCEEQSDEASFATLAMTSTATVHKRNCHCEERSDEASLYSLMVKVRLSAFVPTYQ